MGKLQKRPIQEDASITKSPAEKRVKTDLKNETNVNNKKSFAKPHKKVANFENNKKPFAKPFKKVTNDGRLEETDGKPKLSSKFQKKSTLPKKSFGDKKKPNFTKQQGEQPVDWAEYKKKKKELRLKRRENKDLCDVLPRVKQLAEKIRRKTLEGGDTERKSIVQELHTLLKKNNSYKKFVLAHDTARIVQYVLKFGTPQIRKEVSNELISETNEMLQSKYGKFCLMRILKYGTSDIRSSIIKQFYGNAVKLTSHTLSAPIFEYAYSTFATAQQKQHLIQEFFGDMYKSSKDDAVKQLSDVYKNSPEMKSAILGATKANLSRVLNKDLLDSGLIQSVLCQFLSQCSAEDRNELIGQLSQHIVVLSNSKDGSRAAMQCIWHGTNKDRKVALKALKEHIVELSKHEHGHCTVIGILDAIDDTVLLNKVILTEIIKHLKDLANNEWGRKVILWLVAPGDKAHFHPVFLKELDNGRENASVKKAVDIRRKEILGYCINILLKSIETEPNFWMSNSSIAFITLAILKAGADPELKDALMSLSKVIVDPNWQVKEDEKEVYGIEHAGLHMTLKKLAQNDKIAEENSKTTFGECICSEIEDETFEKWLSSNRGCFFLVALLENGKKSTRNTIMEKINNFRSVLKKQTTAGAKLLMKK